MLLKGDRPADVCFLPRIDAFTIDLSGVVKQDGPITLHDGDGEVVASLTPGEDGKVKHTVDADPARRGRPWRLHFPNGWATVEMDGLTRWASGDLLLDQAVWTPQLSSWFDWHANRWLITPYRQVQYGAPGEAFERTFTIHNNGLEPRTIALSAEYPGAELPVALSANALTVPARGSGTVTVRGTVPAAEATLHLRATPADGAFTTYASLTARPGDGPTEASFEPPLVFQPYDHENPTRGYYPEYPLDNQVYFDLDNRPFIRTNRGLASRDENGWFEVALNEATVERIPEFEGAIGGMPSTKVAFDADNDVYLLAMSGRKRLLLHSQDHGRTFRAYVIPGDESRSRGYDIEQFSGHNTPTGPPPIAQNTSVPTEPDPKLFWRRVNLLDLFLPTKVNGRIEMGEPIPISDKSLGLSGHSGMPSALVSRGDKVHIIWGEATDPAEKVPGVPDYVATYDRATGKLSEPALIGYGPPANDIHNTPSITMDSQGYLHAITGTHGSPFLYARSLVPNDAGGGWTEAEPTGAELQTYVGFLCGADDALHLVYRLGHRNEEPFPLAYHSTLSYQRKKPGQGWEPPVDLVVPAFSEYCVYYHRLTVDRVGNLLLSHDYWNTHWFYRNDQFDRRREVLTSPDGGDTWRFW